MNATEILAGIDLAAVESRIKELEKELDSLRSLKKVLDIQRNGKPNKREGYKPSKAHGRAVAERRESLRKYLIHAGPKKLAVIAVDNELTNEEATILLKHPAFHLEPGGYWRVTGKDS